MTGAKLRAEGEAGVCPCRLTCYASPHPFKPVTGAARVVSNRQDDDLFGMLAKDNGEREALHSDTTTAEALRFTHLGRLTNAIEREVDSLAKLPPGTSANSLVVPDFVQQL
jgi:hypothetical protein